jgi:hypothetical protein
MILGTALAEDPANEDMDYFVAGAVYVPLPGGPLYPTTAALDFNFTLAIAPPPEGPEDEGDDEPVEIPEDASPPYLAH